MGFETLDNAINEGSALERLTEAEVAFTDEQLNDMAAVKLVVQDAVIAEQYLSTKGLPDQWSADDDIYRAYVKSRKWPGTDIPRANLGMPIVLEAIDNHLLPAIFMAFFSDTQPFYLESKGRTTQDTARAMAIVLNWALKESGFKEEIRCMLKSILLYGFGVAKWGWKSYTTNKKVYKYADSTDEKSPKQVISELEEEECNRPIFEKISLRHVLADPGCNRQDIRCGRQVLFQGFITADDLDDLRDTEGYKNIPTREELVKILTAMAEPTTNSLAASQSQNRNFSLQAEKPEVATSADPLSQPLELLERWDGRYVTTVLQRKLCIRNEDHELGANPFLSCAFIDVEDSMYGYGVAKLLSGEQRFQQGVVNSWIDNLAMILNPAFQIQKGLGNSRQNINLSPGLVINENGEMKPLSLPSNSSEALNAIQVSEARANRRVGADGGANLPTQALRTAEGVQAFSQSLNTKLEYFIEQFANLVFIPALEAFADLCKNKLQPNQINKILTEAQGKAFEGNLLDLYNGTYSFDVLVSTKLAARKASAQLLPALLQLFEAVPVHDSLSAQNKKVDFAELISSTTELGGLPLEKIIVEMTPEDQKRAQMQNAGAPQVLNAQQLLAQKHAYDLENIEQTGMARAGVAIVKHSLQESATEQIPGQGH